ncbi:GRAS family protein [Geofilum rubicundum]|nr:GRAS family protein [Geofilum rubicundum]
MKSFPLPTIYEALNLVMQNYPDKFTEESKLEIEALLEHCLDGLGESSEKFLATLFIRAIRKHIGPTTIDEHIYLKRYEVPQIELFNVLIQQFPFVRYSHSIVNQTIADIVQGESTVTILDIGIGQGIQIVNLLERLKRVSGLRKVVVIGVEPFEDALNYAGELINSINYPYNVEFIPVCSFIEAIDFAEIGNMVEAAGGPLIVNESLALHHIQHLNDRHKVIQSVRALNPKAFFLTEPNVDHFEPDFFRRFQNCYNHFYHIFQVIDQLPVGVKEKNGLKLFFGREIEDVIGGSDHERFEKHEPSFRWVEKLTVGGFKMVNGFKGVPDDMGYGIKVDYDAFNGCLGFRFKTETIISLIHAECI